MNDVLQELRRQFTYNAEGGEFSRRPQFRGRWKGKAVAGTVGRHGYVAIRLNDRLYLAHRLAWLHEFGEWPPGNLDHINRIKTDNRIANLRVATPRQNAWNRKMPRHNTSGFKGVVKHVYGPGWIASIRLNGKRKHLGVFASAEEAAAAYDRVAEVTRREFAATNKSLENYV